MKKEQVASILLMALCCAPMQAQGPDAGREEEQKIKLTGGISAESNLSGFIHSGIDGGQSDMEWGAGLGGFLNLGISASFSIQGEMTIQYKSSGFAANNQPGDYRYWGMEIPIYAFYHFMLPKGNQLFIGIGPYTNFGLRASYRTNGEKIDVYAKDKDTDLPVMKDSDTGFGVKLGYEFASGLQITASYKASVTNIIDVNSSKAKMYPQTVSLGIAYRFGK